MTGLTTQAVVLARGLGTRMRRSDPAVALSPGQAAAAEQGMKAMIPVGRPFLDYLLSGLADAGCERVILVIGPEHTSVRDRYDGPARPRRVALDYAIQAEPRGTADAVAAAEGTVANAPFIVINGDNYYSPPDLRALAAHGGAGLLGYRRSALIARSSIDPNRVLAYALIEEDDGYLRRIVEKPDPATAAAFGPDPLVSMNAWSFTPKIFTACRAIGPSPRGELELQDAVRWAQANLAERFRIVPAEDGVLDLSSRGDIAEVARRLESVAVSL
ncbi:MAG: nucleotidyltransferase family protein [Gemmatimonadota bacterium]